MPMCGQKEAGALIMQGPTYCRGPLMTAFTTGKALSKSALCNCFLKIKDVNNQKWPRCRTSPDKDPIFVAELPAVRLVCPASAPQPPRQRAASAVATTWLPCAALRACVLNSRERCRCRHGEPAHRPVCTHVWPELTLHRG